MEIGVMDVDPAPVAVAAVIPRMERLAPSEREPAEAKTNPKAKASEPAHERRAIERRGINRSRAPAPATAPINPAAIVIRGKAPRLVANPTPTPRRNISPVAIAIRSPIRAYIIRSPHIAVGWILFPGTVIIQVAVAHGVSVYVLRRRRIVFAEVALLRPLIQGIGARCGTCRNFHAAVCAGNIDALARLHGIDLAGRCNFSSAANRRHAGEVA